MRILVTGSRTWSDRAKVLEVLSEYAAPGAILVSGRCPRGLDHIAETIWTEHFGLEVEPHEADWDTYGKQAGFVRNQEMVDSNPDVTLAFLDHCVDRKCKRQPGHDSHGTSHTARRSEVAGIPVRRFRP